jgi:hypothetical protein
MTKKPKTLASFSFVILWLLLSAVNSQASSASISCLVTWRAAFGATSDPRFWQKRLLDQYPSERVPAPSQCKTLLIQGEIKEGDYNTTMKLARQSFPFLESLYLNSPGGDASEAIRIGRLARHLMLVVNAPSIDLHAVLGGSPIDQVPTNLVAFDAYPTTMVCNGSIMACSCASACVLIWVGGALHHGDALGLHRPTFQGEKFKSMDPEDAQQVYRVAEDEIVGYLAEMEFPPSEIVEMMSTSSQTIHWPTLHDLDAGLDYESPPSLAEWLNKACPGLSVDENSALSSLIAHVEELTQKQKDRLEELGKRSSQRLECSYVRFGRHRDTMKASDQD